MDTGPEMDTAQEFDVVVIGAGPVGENVADYAHRGGLSVALVEAERVGGECSYWACIPSKALLRPVLALGAAAAVGGARERITGGPAGTGAPDSPAADPAAAFTRRDSFVSDYDDAGQVEWVEEAGLTLVRGRGRLAGERRVTVAGEGGEVDLQARLAVVVCTGTDAFVPPIPGLREAHPWTSREATSASRVPGHLVVIGGGVVACEMATAFAGLGADRVTMLVREDRLLQGIEPFAEEQVFEGLGRRGVDVRLETTAARVDRDADGVTLLLEDGDLLRGSEVLVATGRRPRTGDLGLETVGLEPGDTLEVDESLAVRGVANTTAADGGSRPWLFAAGDVNGRAPLTHHGKYQARLLGEHLATLTDHGTSGGFVREELLEWGPFTPTADTRATVQVIFTDPQVGTVGLTADRARRAGREARVVEVDLGQVSGAALHADGYEGRASIVVDAHRETILGATLVGPDVGEMVHAATIAVVGDVPLSRLWHAVPAFPTMSEVWLRLIEEWRRG